MGRVHRRVLRGDPAAHARGLADVLRSPGPNPSGPFKDYIRRNDFPVQHYYSAYPHAACTEINSALRVRDAFTALRERASTMSARAFDRAWAAFLTDVQSDL